MHQQSSSVIVEEHALSERQLAVRCVDEENEPASHR